MSGKGGLMIVYNQWLDYYESYDESGVGIGDPIRTKEYYFDIVIQAFGNHDVAVLLVLILKT